MDLQLNQKTALVTGSDRGTGQVIAETLAREGARVILHCNDHVAFQTLASKARELSDNALAVSGDISTEAGTRQVVDAIEAQGPVCRYTGE